MVLLNQGATDDRIVVTLNEFKTLGTGSYLFVFTNVTTKEQVFWLALFADDLSSHPERYNEFSINTGLVFSGKQPGQWGYEVYEQSSTVNLDPTGLSLVERGKMYIKYDPNYTFAGYSVDTQFKGYGG